MEESIEMIRNKLIILAVSALVMQSLTGCSQVEEVTSIFADADIQNQEFATKQEIMDYYANSMKYQTVSKRTPMIDENVHASFNTVEQGTEAYEKLRNAFITVEAEHQKVNGYTISQGLHDFLKSFIDDMVLNDGEIKRAKEYGGYYYLTVAYKTTPNISGSFKNQANYMGIDGLIVRGNTDDYEVDTDYLSTLLDKTINPTRTAMELTPYTNFGYDSAWVTEGAAAGTGMFDVLNTDNQNQTVEATTGETAENVEGTEDNTDEAVVDGTETTDETADIEESTDVIDEGTEVTGTEITTNPELPQVGEDGSGATDVAALNAQYIDENGNAVEKTGINNIDRLEWDPAFVNDIAGSSNEQIASIPPINMVYNPAATQGRLNGFGMYKQAKAGLSEFGVTQNDLNNPGEIIVTYVFKQNILKPEQLDYVTLYINEYDSNNQSIASDTIGGSLAAAIDEARLSSETDKVDEDTVKASFAGPVITVPTFLQQQLEMIIEEFDRAVNDKSITALIDGSIIEDVGLGMKYAAYAKSADVVTFKSEIKRIAARNGNNYLLEIERTVEDAPNGSTAVGQYRDTYFVVVRQIGTDFKYNDEIFVRRVNTNVPVINAEDTTVRRLVTLNLSGSVDTNTAKDITDTLINKLAEYAGARNDEFLTLFDSDTNLLNTERRQYITTKLVGQINYMGSGISTSYMIKPSEWISGTENQVEFTTKELIKYNNGNNGGMYIENYYLVSKYGTSWVIDDIITINTQVLDSSEVGAYESQVSGTVATITDNSSNNATE